ncbi:MAG: hypothetical protein JXQ84_05290 [Rhodospirillaceae bacterium]|nr:hypothetical protein [Rhodospirillaceae bacterium]
MIAQAPANRPQDVRSFDPRNEATGTSGGSVGGEVQVKAHTRDGGETSIKAYIRSAPGEGVSSGSSSAERRRGGAVGDFWRNYTDMREANFKNSDKYVHCKANCEATKRGKFGEWTAIGIGEGRELTDQYIKGDSKQDCDDDRIANRHGRVAAKKHPEKSCSRSCAPYRPKGLPPRY